MTGVRAVVALCHNRVKSGRVKPVGAQPNAAPQRGAEP